ncbi:MULTISPECIES: siderophore-interacting protein [Streptomyces]|uniref:Siderophore-interacting protein n=1 Tax=Streptomyces thermoviolaceus subsp. thermoviolaceus TaxID=66860 RepID=A0ABX0YK85_STRTL|nr:MULTISPECIES: siderophore-interacting protein [Streptomyces]MCM3264003.1 siderophore-interacting protein [Streptomyces thermoviolaceus]NJP12898.1 siderophore-interacting protein [Streptomyces thermoviolaceus subsp. thermoviolaceus]RSS00319.1 siderophore-interacting protein [Streptomyces sp. WAC00469]WTD49937.1 siderophore-interacting protein [Streptomyces thermoviolaceus]GGV67866.1 siderophore-interacting protein [Streptomyces thermoviolaceus subsp. apingens]
MAERPARKPRKAHTGRVIRTERLTPHMQRVVLGGEGLAGFSADTCTDHYVKLLFPADGVTYPEPFDIERIRAEFPRAQWPVTRTYTVRDWDAERRELTLDFVLHGDEGLAGRWAVRARPGDTLRFLGPGGAYAPDASADWHLLAGDESALPAIARSLEALPEGAVAHAFVEVSGPQEEQKIDSSVQVTWLHRGTRPVGEALIEAVRGLEFPEGRVHAFVHGEAGCVKELRRLLRVEHAIPREQLSLSGYWRLGHDEDGWQASKREWKARIEAEQEGAAPAA